MANAGSPRDRLADTTGHSEMSLLSTFLDTDNSDDTAMTADEHLILVQQLLEDFGRDPSTLSSYANCS